MSTSSRGSAREHAVKRRWESEGWAVFRGAGSKAIDLIALRDGWPTLIEVKANKGSPWMNFRAEDRAALSLAAEKAGADALLIHWPPNGEYREYRESEWP